MSREQAKECQRREHERDIFRPQAVGIKTCIPIKEKISDHMIFDHHLQKLLKLTK
jgi:hypothetical protein